MSVCVLCFAAWYCTQQSVFSVRHQELKIVHTASGICQTNTWRSMCSFELLMMDGKTRLKHVERLTEINKLWNVASCSLYSANLILKYCCHYIGLYLETQWKHQATYLRIVGQYLFINNKIHDPMEKGKPMHCQHNFVTNWVDILIVFLLLQLYWNKSDKPKLQSWTIQKNTDFGNCLLPPNSEQFFILSAI
jgi:hypothetical protein